MKTTILISALGAATLGPSAVLATPINNARSPAPWTVKLQSRQVPAGEVLARQLQARNKPKPDDVSLTEWIDRGQDIQYYGKIKVGKPAQKFTVIFDTGSSDLLLPGENCSTCNSPEWPHPLFDPRKSSTFSPLPGDQFQQCFGTGGTTIPFADENQCADITVVTDKVCIDDLCAPAQQWLLGANYAPALLEQPFDGILGMPIEKATNAHFYWYLVQSGQLPSPEFSIYVEPRKVHGAEITLGGIDKSKFKGDITTIPQSPIATDYRVTSWVLQLPALYIDGKRVVNTSEPGIGSPLPYAEAKLDFGTAFMGAPNNESARDIYAAISPLIRELDHELGIWGAPCDVVDRVAKDVTFTFGAVGGPQLNLTVPKENFNAGPLPGKPGICQTIYSPLLPGTHEPVNHNPGWVIGAPLFKNYYTVWNGRDMTFGVARPNWEKASAP